MTPSSAHTRHVPLTTTSPTNQIMSRIRIACSLPLKNLEATRFLHQCLGLPLSKASAKLAAGAAGFFYDGQVYSNEHVQEAATLRAILAFFQARAIPLTIHEISAEQDWSDVDPQQLDNITLDEKCLGNLLDSSEGQYS